MLRMSVEVNSVEVERSWVTEVREMVGQDSPKGKEHRPRTRRLCVDLLTIYLLNVNEKVGANLGVQ